MASVEIALGVRELVTLPPDLESVLVRAGEIWVTRDHDVNDFILRKGDLLSLAGSRGVLVSAFTPARLALQVRTREGAVASRWTDRRIGASSAAAAARTAVAGANGSEA